MAGQSIVEELHDFYEEVGLFYRPGIGN